MRQICSYSQPGMEKVTASINLITIVRQEMRLENKDNLVLNSFEIKIAVLLEIGSFESCRKGFQK